MNNNLIMVEPVVPTYLVNDDGYVTKIVKYLFDARQRDPIKYVIQDVSGLCLIEEDEDAIPFSTLPLHPDTVADDSVYDQFEAADFDCEDTLREFKAWGINKVYLDPYYDRIIPMEDFLNGVLKHFVDNDMDYAPASLDEKAVIFQ